MCLTVFDPYIFIFLCQQTTSSLAIINIKREVSNQLKAEDILIEYVKTNKRLQL